MIEKVTVIDDFLPNPEAYRAAVIALDFRSFHFPGETFHGIAIAPLDSLVPQMVRNIIQKTEPSLSFFRKSPEGQQEPHFIHTDIDMGDWTALLYLNPNPPKGDGTTFWTHKATGAIGSAIPHERSKEGQVVDGWTPRQTVNAKFNRLLMFHADQFHSRAMFENWGHADDARLTQVTFLKESKQ